jgi:hypothetical protein
MLSSARAGPNSEGIYAYARATPLSNRDPLRLDPWAGLTGGSHPDGSPSSFGCVECLRGAEGLLRNRHHQWGGYLWGYVMSALFPTAPRK